MRRIKQQVARLCVQLNKVKSKIGNLSFCSWRSWLVLGAALLASWPTLMCVCPPTRTMDLDKPTALSTLHSCREEPCTFSCISGALTYVSITPSCVPKDGQEAHLALPLGSSLVGVRARPRCRAQDQLGRITEHLHL